MKLNINQLTSTALSFRQVFWLMTVFVLTAHTGLQAQQAGYFVKLTDKNNSPFSLSRPHEFLSQRAIERRLKQNIGYDNADIPVNADYVSRIEECGVKIRHTSRWMNGVIISSNNTEAVETIKNLPFVASVEKTKDAGRRKSTITKTADIDNRLKTTVFTTQLCMLNGSYLHQQGYTGAGMQIAIIDAGFFNANNTNALSHVFDQNRILGTKDFVGDSTPFYETSLHGMQVLSVMAAKTDEWLTGSAPDASYYLFRTEDQASEYPIEADYWVCAAELADSLGVDIIQSSVGYFNFDNETMNYTPAMLNGSTRISQAAQTATEKGMIVVNSAGNEGQKPWRYIITPADAPGVLTVGAVGADAVRAPFSSQGYEHSGIIKPDVMAQGAATRVISIGNTYSTANGTSYSSPIIAGLTACLWQSNPNKTAAEIKDAIIRSASRWETPDLLYGYGIPNFKESMKIPTSITDIDKVQIEIYPNPFTDRITVSIKEYSGAIKLSILSLDGKTIWTMEKSASCNFSFRIPPFLPGVYILKVGCNNFALSRKIIRQ